MKDQKIFLAVNKIDDDLISEAAEYRPEGEINGEVSEGVLYTVPAGAKRTSRLWKYPVTAAALLGVMGGALFVINNTNGVMDSFGYSAGTGEETEESTEEGLATEESTADSTEATAEESTADITEGVVPKEGTPDSTEGVVTEEDVTQPPINNHLTVTDLDIILDSLIAAKAFETEGFEYHTLDNGTMVTVSKNYVSVYIDNVEYGIDVLALEDGVVTDVDCSLGRGRYICIEGSDGNTVFYSHLSEQRLEKGDTVKKGETIGCTGTSGYAVAPAAVRYSLLK